MIHLLCAVSIILLLVCGAHQQSSSQDNEIYQPIVKTTFGQVEGTTVQSPQGKFVDMFLGIPYAAAMTGENRFAPPKDPQPWTGILSAKSKPDACIQGRLILVKNESDAWWSNDLPESEDCLKLNIWTPSPRKEKLAVLVWIHGGGWQLGTASSDLYDGRTLSSEENIVVVSLNYRLASLGFLYLDHPDVPGNMALMDQTLALRWIKDNIQNFGGDTERITLAGESAGAASTGYQLMLRSSIGLFQRGIIMSGSILASWAMKTKEDALKTSLKFAETLNCVAPGEVDMDEVVRCLKTKTVDEIRTGNHAFPQELIPFPPVIDGVYLSTDGKRLLDQRKFCGEKNVMVGSTSGDGAIFLQVLKAEVDWTNDTTYTQTQFKEIIKVMVGSDNDQLANAVMFNYIDWNDPENSEKLRSGIVDFLTDEFICADNYFSDSYAANGNHVYKYKFEHGPVNKKCPKWARSLHGDELPFMFGVPLDPSKGFNSDEVVLSRTVMRYWSNFVKHGNPNSGPGEITSWPKYSISEKKNLLIGTRLSIRKGDRLRECAFWDHVFPDIVNLVNKQV